jgi:ABC-2 type transport system permease protein
VLLSKPLAFLKTDFLMAATYKFAFAAQFAGIFLSALTFFFLSKLLGVSGSPHLEPYGGDYFSFVLIGIAFGSYLSVSMQSFSQAIRGGQMLGTLEALLVTQTDLPVLIVSSSLYSFVMTSIRVVAFLVIGALALGLDLGNANVLGAVVVLLLTIVCFSSLGIISASFILVLKKGDPLSWLFTHAFSLLGGVYYPVTILPDWLQSLSYVLPITYSLEGMRLALLRGYSLGELLPNIVPLVIFGLVMMPIGLLSFGYAVRRAKRDGTLTHY